MWLLTTLIAAVIVTSLHFIKNLRKYHLDLLALMLWGAFIMILVDSIMGVVAYGQPFMVTETNGLITNPIMLGITMLIPVFIIWIAILYFKGSSRKTSQKTIS